MVEGAVEGLREQRLLFARIESVILAFGGSRVSPLQIIGEDEPDDEGISPFGPESPVSRRARMLERLAEQHAREHLKYLPPEMLDDEVTP